MDAIFGSVISPLSSSFNIIDCEITLFRSLSSSITPSISEYTKINPPSEWKYAYICVIITITRGFNNNWSSFLPDLRPIIIPKSSSVDVPCCIQTMSGSSQNPTYSLVASKVNVDFDNGYVKFFAQLDNDYFWPSIQFIYFT